RNSSVRSRRPRRGPRSNSEHNKRRWSVSARSRRWLRRPRNSSVRSRRPRRGPRSNSEHNKRLRREPRNSSEPRKRLRGSAKRKPKSRGASGCFLRNGPLDGLREEGRAGAEWGSGFAFQFLESKNPIGPETRWACGWCAGGPPTGGLRNLPRRESLLAFPTVVCIVPRPAWRTAFAFHPISSGCPSAPRGSGGLVVWRGARLSCESPRALAVVSIAGEWMDGDTENLRRAPVDNAENTWNPTRSMKPHFVTASVDPSFPTPHPSCLARFGLLPNANLPYVIVGMFTASHQPIAQRLADSLATLKLPHLLFEVPSVHRSTSPKGNFDPSGTKPNFIANCLRILGRPLVYVDCDVVFCHPPTLFDQLVQEKIDFGILNWLALERNDAYKPVVLEDASSSNEIQRRFFQISHQIPFSSQNQLLCSGAVQFWGQSESAFSLLAAWHECILNHPQVPDDHCLDCAFNNTLSTPESPLRSFWLPKSYARYAWWIFDEPIIDHPQFPYAGSDWASLESGEGKKRIHLEQLTPRDPVWAFPEQLIFDAQSKVCYRVEGSLPVPVGKLDNAVFL
ncbi:MAG: hypothetical protein RLZZ142_63, partial [Verrucomicrobiota bacterium]